MLRTLWTSKMGMNAQQQKLDAISNNISNSSTNGYKKVNVGFKDLLSESLDRKGYPINDRTSIMGTGVRTATWNRNNTQGNLLATEKSTDLAIDGPGNYFRLTASDGSKVYSRDGSFRIDSTGTLVDSSSNKLDIQYEPGRNSENTQFKQEGMMCDSQGNLFIKEGDVFNKVGKINLYTAVGDGAFQSAGENLFLPSPGVTVEVVNPNTVDIIQGFLEGSNVNIAEEMTDMIVTQRAFQLSSKSLETADEMWGMINNMRS